jgi:hypothetical protein
MGKEFRTHNDPTAANYGDHYPVSEQEYPYGARRRASGTELVPQTRSVESMKAPLRSDELSTVEQHGTFIRHKTVGTEGKIVGAYVEGVKGGFKVYVPKEKKVFALPFNQLHDWERMNPPKANIALPSNYGEYVARSLHDGTGNQADTVRVDKPAHSVDLKLTTVNVDELEPTQHSPDLDKRSMYFQDAIDRGETIPPPLVHRLPDGTIQIIDGHARVDAFRKKGIKEIPVVENGLTDVLKSAGHALSSGVKHVASGVGHAVSGFSKGASSGLTAPEEETRGTRVGAFLGVAAKQLGSAAHSGLKTLKTEMNKERQSPRIKSRARKGTRKRAIRGLRKCATCSRIQGSPVYHHTDNWDTEHGEMHSYLLTGIE